MKSREKTGFFAVMAVVFGLLGGCGGGDSGALGIGASNAGIGAGNAGITGIAATGAAIAGGSFSMSCVSGLSGITDTGSDGSFSLPASGITFPCIGRVDYTDSAGAKRKLHTFINAAGTANVTPFTELLIASLTGGTPLDAFDKFDASKVKAFTAAQLTTAIAAVQAYLVTLGVSVTNFPADPIGAKFVANWGTTSGDKVDGVLDDMAAKLKTAGKELSDAVADVAKIGGSTTASLGAGCTGDALAFFTKKKGSYASTADLRGSTSTVAGFKEGTAVTVVVSENCTVSLGSTTLTYKDGTYEKFSDGQVNVVVTAPGFTTFSSYEVFANGGGLLSLGDTKTGAFANFFMK